MSTIQRLPITSPARPTAPPGPALTDDQQDKLQKCIDNFSSPDFKIGGIDVGPGLTEDERFWLTKECFLRYLRASKWHLPTALARVESTMKWRREFGIYDEMTAEYVEVEGETGKELIFGFDTSGRPALFMYPSRQNTTEQKKQLQFAIFMLERAIDLMGPGVEAMDLLINFADRAKNPALGTARLMLNYLQNHYPERLGLALIANVPMLVNAFFKVITPFIDPITREKIKFNPRLIEDKIFTPDQTTTDWGGDVTFEFEHAQYWPKLILMCDESRAKQRERWRALGAKVGLSEWDIKGGGSEGGVPLMPVPDVGGVSSVPVEGGVDNKEAGGATTESKTPVLPAIETSSAF